jgi:type VII secretion protein EccE
MMNAMATPPSPARAVAQVDRKTAADPQGGPTPRRDQAATGRNLLRVMLVQAVLLGVLGVVAAGPKLWALAILAGLIVVTAIALLRRRRRWGTEQLGIAWRHRRRRRVAITDRGSPVGALQLLVPELRVADLTGSDGLTVGVARDASGWFAAAVVSSAIGLDAPIPFSRLARSLAEAGEPSATVQVVQYTAPAPALDLDPSQPGAASYRLLLETCGQLSGARTRYLAARIDEVTLAEAAADGDADRTPQAADLAAAMIRRFTRAAAQAGLTCHILDAAGLVDALGRCLDLADPELLEATRPAGRESWRSWQSARLAHATFWIRGWPASAGALIDRIPTVPDAAVSVALTVHPHGTAQERGDCDVQAFARVAARPDDLRRAVTVLRGLLKQAGARPFRLDGEHAPAAYATAPTGGGARR